MRVLLIAPQPFFAVRGTPIAVDLLARALSQRGDRVDLLTTHLGEDRSYPGFTLVRVTPPFAPKQIPPGLGIAKIYCDLFILFRALRTARRARYELVHAVEEASFMAWIVNILGGPPYIVDIDSSMATQIVRRLPWLKWAERFLRWLEHLPLRRSVAVVAVCDALAVDARRLCPGETVVIPDVSLTAEDPLPADDIRELIGANDPIVMYIGNLEPYQGIDLLLGAFSTLNRRSSRVRLVVIGGADEHIRTYRNRTRQLGLEERVHFIGPRPVAALHGYLRQADVLVSPRVEGVNTPMKIYSYLDSSRPLVATDITSHNQVIDDRYAILAPPEPEAFADVIQQILYDNNRAKSMVEAAKDLIAREHSHRIFVERVHAVYDDIEAAFGIKDPG